MKKNRTEFFPSNIIKFIPKTQKQLSKRERKNYLKKILELELKSNPEEISNYLKKILAKNEITKEIYLSKHISKDKKLQPNLLITKIYVSEKMLENKRKLLGKIPKENSLFLKAYKNIKNSKTKTGKMTGQLEYLNNVTKLYLSKDYDLNNNGINNNENIFKYSILNDKDFGNDINNDVLRIIKEMDNNDFLKEQQLIFDFQDEILKEKMNNKVDHPAEALIKSNFINKEDDYGIDDISFLKRKKSKLLLHDLEENNNENTNIKGEQKEKTKEEKEEVNNDINMNNNRKKARPSFLYLQIKNDIKKMQKNLMDLDKLKSNYKNERLIKIQKNFKPRFSLVNNSFDNELKKESNTNEKGGKEEKGKDNQVPVYNKTEINNEINKNNKPILLFGSEERKTNKKIAKINNIFERFSVINKLPNINKVFQDKQNKITYTNLKKNSTPNISFNNKDSKKGAELFYKRKNAISQTFIYHNGKKLNNNGIKPNEDNKLMNLKKEISNNKSLNSILDERFVKLPMKKEELNRYIDKFKKKKPTLYDSFVKNEKEINLHGFANKIQRLTEEKNFGNIYNNNKYLKKNNFNYLMSNNDLLPEEDNEGINIQKVDDKIGNIVYDSADFLLGNHIINKNQILG